ncbi:C-C chemokine receptor 1-like protein 1 [Stylophora pistillata]|uniref:C-C chemokine receptor 1-like protein 1 n=1 Tax=Stylophora pistillata TaxID=50429 RepID=UPI000C03BC3D|nr:C-C chemokine receptor 1-like protein 1 [Stylophora pistillata]
MEASWLFIAAYLLLRNVVAGVQSLNNSTFHCDIDTRCNCLPKGLWDARCQLNGSTGPPKPMVLFKSLDLSKNNLQDIPTEFLVNQTHLVNLSLACNQISVIKDGAFGSLLNVTFLDLSFNPLRRWKGDVIRQLPNLKTLVVTGSVWTPNSNILKMPSLRTVEGVTWSDNCANCTLFKEELSFSLAPNMDHNDERPARNFFEHGYLLFCPSNRSCSAVTFKHPKHEKNVKTINVPKKLFYSSYVMGTVAILLNLIVLITIIFARSLRRSTSMWLILNMALCDLLIGIYSVLIGNLNIFSFLSSIETDKKDKKLVLGGEVLCPLATAIFTSAECVAAVTSFLLTVEKYYSIVHCMNPDRRLSKKVAAICLVFCWILSLVYAISPEFHFLNLSYSATMMCSFPVAERDTFLICLCVLVALYIANIPLYLRIFLFVRRSGAQLGIKREEAILKKIALVVGSNFILLLAPMILIIIFVPVEDIHNKITLRSDRHNEMLFVFGFWFPIALLGLNSCINPILGAFRQGTFAKQITSGFRWLRILPSLNSLRRHKTNRSLSQLSTVTSQIVLCKVTQLKSM